jgi:urease accessory protein UreF
LKETARPISRHNHGICQERVKRFVYSLKTPVVCACVFAFRGASASKAISAHLKFIYKSIIQHMVKLICDFRLKWPEGKILGKKST